MSATAVLRLLAFAAVATPVASVAHGAPGVVVDGRLLQCPTPPLTHQGALLLPMRAVFEALHAQVQWRPAERKLEASRGDTLIELWIGTPVAHVNRNPIQLGTPPLLVAGAAYVPLRFVAEAFGGVVRWDEPTQTAFVYSPAQ